MTEQHRPNQDRETSRSLEQLALSVVQSGNYVHQASTAYDELLQQEAEPANPEELISVSIVAGGAEAIRLREYGISQEVIEAGKITRADLLGAGFAFINKIGGGEKPLLSVRIDSDEGPIDLGGRTLLTQQELDIAKASQDKTEFDDEDTRMLMLNFLKEAQGAHQNKRENEIKLLREAQQRIISDGSQEELARVAAYFKELIDKSDQAYGWAAKEWLAGLDIARVGAIPVEMFWTRRQSIRGAPSPFLDSGYHFGDNEDVTLFPNDAGRTRRLNTVVVHLLSRGISQLGGSRNGSHDQTYITNSEFLALLPYTVQKEGDVDDETVNVVMERILARSMIVDED